MKITLTELNISVLIEMLWLRQKTYYFMVKDIKSSVSVSTTRSLLLLDPEFIIILFPLQHRHRLISAGLEPVLGHTEKSCIASYYRQLSTNIKIKS